MSIDPVAVWHQLAKARDVRGLDALLADEAIFYSPVVHTPQVGKAITTKYLAAAFQVFLMSRFTTSASSPAIEMPFLSSSSS